MGLGNDVGLASWWIADLLRWRDRHLYFQNFHRDQKPAVYYRSQSTWYWRKQTKPKMPEKLTGRGKVETNKTRCVARFWSK